MLKINISDSDLEMLKEKRYNHPHPRVQQKMEVLILKKYGLKDALICQITNICGNTLRKYLKQYQKGGIALLEEVNFYKPSSELNKYSGTIKQYFTENPPTSILQASAKIEEITGIKRSETQTRKFLKSLNFKYIKTCSVPAKVLTDEKKKSRKNFWKKTLNQD